MLGSLGFFTTDYAIAFIACLIFFFIIVALVIRKAVTVSTSLLLLTSCAVTGLLISHYHSFQTSFQHWRHPEMHNEQEQDLPSLENQIFQAVEDLKNEIVIEKDHLNKMTTEVQDILKQVEMQKQKLQKFIDETHEQLLTHPATSLSKPSSSDEQAGFLPANPQEESEEDLSK